LAAYGSEEDAKRNGCLFITAISSPENKDYLER